MIVHCLQRETVFCASMQCFRLKTLFTVLQNLLVCFGETFSVGIFICGFEYVQLLNFLLGLAKMAIYNTRKHKIEWTKSYNLEAVFFNSVKSRILIDFWYYNAMNDLVSFYLIWCYKGALCEIIDDNLHFASLLI